MQSSPKAPPVDKKSLTEADVRTKFITPAIEQSGWDLMTQMREEVYFTAGRVIVRGGTVKRGEKKRADYVLSFRPNQPIAIVEAKDNKHPFGAGMQQALEYADTLHTPFVFTSNGDGFLFHDLTVKDLGGEVERTLTLDEFPSPGDLWARYCLWKGLTDEKRTLVEEDYHSDGLGKTPRYYQMNAINRTIEAVANGQKRNLLVMATGTGKTYTAFQIIWRLWKARSAKRILFLADRNILVDQTKTNDFKPFGSAMTKITNRKIDKSYEVYLALYQAVTGHEEDADIFREFSPDFFDLIVIDECHRGSAAADSAWRRILEYFESATQIGLTATPKETAEVSNIDYFGKPVYSYSLKQGIEDGFLAPYKVHRIDFDRDVEGWRPDVGQKDQHGNEIEDRIYNQVDMDRKLVLEQRTELVAQKITDLIQATDPYSKTIVFCEDVEHAERMRQALVRANPEQMAVDRRYVMRITGDDTVGKAELDNFIDPESRYPVIVTTSKLLSTGVDCQTCKIVALDQRIQSMTEFKQIIGRGTRINEDYGKFYFTIMDFKKVTELFADPDFDGEPVQVYKPGPNDPPEPPDDEPPEGEDIGPGDDGGEWESGEWEPEPGTGEPLPPGSLGPRKFYVSGVTVSVVGERVQYYGNDGKLITESLRDYTKKAVRKEFASLDEFLQRWTQAGQKQAMIEELENQGLLLEALSDEVGKDFGPFDLICHVAFDQPPLTRRERADNVRKRNYFTQYGEQARAVLDALLEKYADEGILSIEDTSVLRVRPFSEFGTPVEIVRLFGDRNGFRKALQELEAELYAEAG
ncbi:MAG: DEAD/DEAH box helicase family protein [Planctomycetota bacterium]|nr:DEAD/DEAH box helicase family protein [Planctomycetota bacterium]